MVTTVLVYTKNNCRPCKSTKHLLDKLEISYEEISLDENPEIAQQLREEGWGSSPVVKTPYSSWAGFQYDKIKAIKTI